MVDDLFHNLSTHVDESINRMGIDSFVNVCYTYNSNDRVTEIYEDLVQNLYPHLLESIYLAFNKFNIIIPCFF